MKNQKTQQSETSVGQVKNGNRVKSLPKAGLGHGISATAFAIIWLMMTACASSSRPSTPSEIAAQQVFQDKLNTAQKELQQKVDVAQKEAEEKQDAIGK